MIQEHSSLSEHVNGVQNTRGNRVVTTAQKKLNVAINGFGRIGRSTSSDGLCWQLEIWPN